MDCRLGGMDSHMEAWAAIQVSGQKGAHRNACAGGQTEGSMGGWTEVEGEVWAGMDRYGWLHRCIDERMDGQFGGPGV